MKQRGVSGRRSGWLRGGQVPDRLISRTILPVRQEWSLKRLTTAAVVAASDFNKVSKKGYAVLYGIADDTCSLRQASVPGDESEKEHVKGIVIRILNDFRIADSALDAIVLSHCHLSLKYVG
jgi:hypothetical protein